MRDFLKANYTANTLSLFTKRILLACILNYKSRKQQIHLHNIMTEINSSILRNAAC